VDGIDYCLKPWPLVPPRSSRPIAARRATVSQCHHYLVAIRAPFSAAFKRFDTSSELAMARTSKDCIFCGQSPTTREHIWADWLVQYIPKTMPKHNSTTTMLNADRTVDKISKVWGGDPRSRLLQIVCGPCNNGWMSDLQTAAKPTLIPLITGKSTLP
jgi:hypothetical protein